MPRSPLTDALIEIDRALIALDNSKNSVPNPFQPDPTESEEDSYLRHKFYQNLLGSSFYNAALAFEHSLHAFYKLYGMQPPSSGHNLKSLLEKTNNILVSYSKAPIQLSFESYLEQMSTDFSKHSRYGENTVPRESLFMAMQNALDSLGHLDSVDITVDQL
ncbi:MAG: hypothetical protein EOO88_21345, partial [Pedobacter sp.]